MSIPKEFIDDLISRLDIVSVIDRHIPLKKSGDNYVACCPFHKEKSASFKVSQPKHFYHCFGCGAHGDAIDFLRQYSGMGYGEAINVLAKSIGLNVPVKTIARHPVLTPPDDWNDTMQNTMQNYRDHLKNSERAIAYLKKLGLSGKIAARFGLGYVPRDANNSVSVDNQDNDFRDSIIFPFINLSGQVVGFSAHELEQISKKHTKSPKTPYFDKNRELYGLFQAQRNIRDKSHVLMVKNYMDVVVLAEKGLNYVVAPPEIKITTEHITKLLQITDHVIFSFGNDNDEKKLAWDTLKNALSCLKDNKRMSFLFLPEDHNPCSFVKEFGKDAFEKRIKEAMPLSVYFLREVCFKLDLDDLDGCDKLVERANPLLDSIKSAPFFAFLMRKEIASLAKTNPPNPGKISTSIRQIKNLSGNSTRNLQLKMMQLLLIQPSLSDKITFKLNNGISDSKETKTLNAMIEVIIQYKNEFASKGIPLSGSFLYQSLSLSHKKILSSTQTDMFFLDDNFNAEEEFESLSKEYKKHSVSLRVSPL